MGRQTRVGVYAGSYDPFTYGHLSVVRGACRVFDDIVIAVGHNPNKHTSGLFTPEQRLSMIESYLREAEQRDPETFLVDGDHPRCRVQIFDARQLLIDFARTLQPCALIRGLRAVTDFEAEMGIADANRRQEPTIQTVFIPAQADAAFISSSIVKELAMFPDSRLDHYVNAQTEKALRSAMTA